MERCIIVVLTGLLVTGTGCAKPPQKAAAQIQGAAQAPDADVISTFTLVGHGDQGRKKWEVRGRSADLLSTTVHLSPVEATSYGEIQLDVTADEGWYHKETQNVELKKNVVAVTSDGARLTTESFQWQAQEGRGQTSDWVTVTRPGMTIVGQGGVCFPKMKKVRLERRVTVTMEGENGQTVVTCDGPMEVDYGRRTARFWRHVVVTDAKGTIRSDRMDILLLPAENRIEKASFWGHVRIRQESQWATAHRAHYWQPQGRTSLIGHPRLVMLPQDERWGE
ncbi:MAG: LPS export ABC transporter periplasmic protein LptC [Candidatus Omnitrophica bacterium]|nr:LPS export ABC transporter periplasmic protein LptC [Candidatus Omnitrophota bacterium]